MYNWSTDEKELKRQDPEAFEIWRLEQLINHGLGNERLNENLLKKHWGQLFMDIPTKEYLEFLLWEQK